MAKNITLNGKAVTLIGRKISKGTTAPNFKVVNNNMEEVTLDNFNDKIKVLTSFVSVDTPVCDLQVKAFNKQASTLSSDVIILGISKDLPFAQAKFCSANEIKNVITLSDYKYSSFGLNYGLLIKENNLLARSVIILDANNAIRYIQIVDELTNAPNYDAALNALNEVIKSKPLEIIAATNHCIPCESGTPPLPKNEIEKRLPQYVGWQLVDDKKLVKEFKFKNFVDAKYFFDLLAIIAEEQGHHPNFTLIYNKLKITLTTHVAGGLTNNDFIMAKIIDEIADANAA